MVCLNLPLKINDFLYLHVTFNFENTNGLEEIGASAEADLGLLQHPRWSTL